jgi:uncharacterized membrane protein YdjX (TVP38/TMEM64 family)
VTGAKAVRASSTVRLAAGIFLLVVLIASLVFLPAAAAHLRPLFESIAGLGPMAPLVFGVVYVVAVVAFVPGSLLTLAAGFLFGMFLGTITVSVASTIGALAAFLLGRTLARCYVEERIPTNARFLALDEAIRQNGFRIVLLLRLSLAFPFNLLNYMLGLTKVSIGEYVFASWIGMLPGTLTYVYLGSTIKSLADLSVGNYEGSMPQNFLFAAGLLATIVLALVVTRLAKRSLREAATSLPGSP